MGKAMFFGFIAILICIGYVSNRQMKENLGRQAFERFISACQQQMMDEMFCVERWEAIHQKKN